MSFQFTIDCQLITFRINPANCSVRSEIPSQWSKQHRPKSTFFHKNSACIVHLMRREHIFKQIRYFNFLHNTNIADVVSFKVAINTTVVAVTVVSEGERKIISNAKFVSVVSIQRNVLPVHASTHPALNPNRIYIFLCKRAENLFIYRFVESFSTLKLSSPSSALVHLFNDILILLDNFSCFQCSFIALPHLPSSSFQFIVE